MGVTRQGVGPAASTFRDTSSKDAFVDPPHRVPLILPGPAPTPAHVRIATLTCPHTHSFNTHIHSLPGSHVCTHTF